VSKEGNLFLTTPVARGHNCSSGILVRELLETLHWHSQRPHIPITECGCSLQIKARLFLNKILSWWFHCGFTICPKDEGTPLKDIWIFWYQTVHIKELFCAVLEMLYVLQVSRNTVVIKLTCWDQESLPCRDQGTAD